MKFNVRVLSSSSLKIFRDNQGKRLVVRNGKSKARKVTTGCGTFSVEAPRVNDKREGQKFTSKLFPPYLRRSQNVESILPILYLKGLSGNAFADALSDLLRRKSSFGRCCRFS